MCVVCVVCGGGGGQKRSRSTANLRNMLLEFCIPEEFSGDAVHESDVVRLCCCRPTVAHVPPPPYFIYRLCRLVNVASCASVVGIFLIDCCSFRIQYQARQVTITRRLQYRYVQCYVALSP